MLVKFEQNRMVRTIQKFCAYSFDQTKKWLTISDKVLTPFWKEDVPVTETIV